MSVGVQRGWHARGPKHARDIRNIIIATPFFSFSLWWGPHSTETMHSPHHNTASTKHTSNLSGLVQGGGIRCGSVLGGDVECKSCIDVLF
jgi:hypothetical protein